MLQKILFVILLFCSITNLHAAKNYTWEGDVDSSWTTNANWSANPTTGGGRPFFVTGPANYTDAPVITSTPVGFTMEDFDFSGGSLVQMRGGTVVVTGDVGIRGGSDLIVTGGALTIRGNLYMFDSGSSIVLNGGDITVVGDLLLGETDGTIADGTDGATSITILNGDLVANNITFDDNTGDTHSISISGGSITTTDINSAGEDVVLDISGTATVIINDDLLMTGGNDDITMSNGTMLVSGDWNNQGTSDMSGGQVIFAGTGNSTITNPEGQEFYILRNNKNLISTIELADSIIIENYLDFKLSAARGGIINGNGHTLTFLDNSQYFDADDGSHFNGAVNIVGNASFIFPIGDGTFFRPITLASAPNTTSDMYQAEYFGTNPDGLYPLANREAGIATASQLEYWRYERLIGTSNETAILSWNAGSLVGDLADLLWVRWDLNDSEWKNEGNGGTSGGSTITSGGLFSDGAISEFGIFTFGSTSLNNPLPVELIDFNANIVDNTVKLSWSTLTEINNNHFVIERSFDGKNVAQRGSIYSKAENGNSTNRLEYTFEDNVDFENIAYYRLVQIDHDGTSKAYPFVSLKHENSSIAFKGNANDILVYPNPTNNNNFKVRLSTNDDVEFKLYSVDSKEFNIDVSYLGNNEFQIKIKSSVPRGIHFLQIIPKNDLDNIQVKKILLH